MYLFRNGGLFSSASYLKKEENSGFYLHFIIFQVQNIWNSIVFENFTWNHWKLLVPSYVGSCRPPVGSCRFVSACVVSCRRVDISCSTLDACVIFLFSFPTWRITFSPFPGGGFWPDYWRVENSQKIGWFLYISLAGFSTSLARFSTSLARLSTSMAGFYNCIK